MHWSGVPSGIAELVLIMIDLNAPGSQRVFPWAVAGIRPKLHGLSPGRLPRGAVAGRNSFGENHYDICPPSGAPHSYGMFLYALRHSLSLRTGFDPNAVYEKIGGAGLTQGQSGFAYKRS